MKIPDVVAEIDAEIARLEEAKRLLTGAPAKRGAKPQGVAKKKRNLSPEARAKIAAAQKKRWAAARKAKG